MNISHNPNCSLNILENLGSKLLFNTWIRLKLGISNDIFLKILIQEAFNEKSQDDHDAEKV